MHENIPLVTFLPEMFDNVARMYRAGVLSVPEGMTEEGYLSVYRSALYGKLIKSPPAVRLSQSEIREAAASGFTECLFVFLGEVSGKWIPMISRLTPQSASAEHMFDNPDLYIDSQGFVYHMKHVGICLAVYRLNKP